MHSGGALKLSRTTGKKTALQLKQGSQEGGSSLERGRGILEGAPRYERPGDLDEKDAMELECDESSETRGESDCKREQDGLSLSTPGLYCPSPGSDGPIAEASQHSRNWRDPQKADDRVPLEKGPSAPNCAMPSLSHPANRQGSFRHGGGNMNLARSK